MKGELLVALARCRVINGSDLEDRLKHSEDVVQSLLDEKLVLKTTELYKGVEIDTFYLTDKGEAYVKAKLKQVKEIYRGFNLEQDLAISDFYMRRSEKEKESWITRDDLIKKHQIPGTVDGAFINEEGRLEAVKTVSQKSGYDALKKVEDFIKTAEIPYVHYIVYLATVLVVSENGLNEKWNTHNVSRWKRWHPDNVWTLYTHRSVLSDISGLVPL